MFYYLCFFAALANKIYADGMIIELQGKTITAMRCTHLESSEIEFLQQIKKELSIQTYDEVIKRVISVLQALRQTLNRESADKVMNELPDFFKLAFIGSLESDEQLVVVHHLDEFVSLVQTGDVKSGKFYFTSEVQILSISILTLKKLFEFDNLKNFEGISPYIRQQLSEVSAEEIAA